MSRRAALDRIETILRDPNGDTLFQKVYRCEPLGLTPGTGPFAAFWVAGESDKTETLGNVMVHHRFQVACYWPLVGADETTRAG